MRNRRGVTPIISVVLLLMMTVAVAGLAWVWLQGMTTGTMDATKNMTDIQMKQMLTIIDLADYGLECAGTTVTNIDLQVFNRGSTPININANGVVINGKVVSNLASQQVSTGAIGTLNISSATTYVKGLNSSNTKTADIMITAAEGYIKKTLTIDGARCNQ